MQEMKGDQLMNKISKVMQSITLAAAAFLMVFLFSVNTEAASTGTVYFAVEKFTIGQGYLVEPCQVTITEAYIDSDNLSCKPSI